MAQSEVDAVVVKLRDAAANEITAECNRRVTWERARGHVSSMKKAADLGSLNTTTASAWDAAKARLEREYAALKAEISKASLDTRLTGRAVAWSLCVAMRPAGQGRAADLVNSNVSLTSMPLLAWSAKEPGGSEVAHDCFSYPTEPEPIRLEDPFEAINSYERGTHG